MPIHLLATAMLPLALAPASPDPGVGLTPARAEVLDNGLTVVQEYAMRVADSPEGRGWVKLFETAFTAHPYRMTPIGRLEVIEKAPLESFRTFYEQRYVPNQMVVSVVGDFDPEDMLRRIRE